MARVALLIGTGTFGAGFEPLPTAPKDVLAWEQVLADPEMGGFDEVKTLINANHSDMAQTIETWFRAHTSNDLALLFISGHGVKDRDLNLFFAASNTRKEREELVRSTAVSARDLRDWIRQSKSKRQIVILDCCFSGAFGDLLAKDDGFIDLENLLGAEGRVVMASSTSTQYSFVAPNGQLSVYTRYLVEGIRTGAADFDEDGAITVDELHQFASVKVQEESPAMTPKIIVLKDEGFRIRIAKAPLNNPKTKYRKEVEAIIQENDGEIDEIIDRSYLEELSKSLGITSEDAKSIEIDVIEPLRQRKAKIERYSNVYLQAVQRQYPLSEANERGLERLRRVLSLRVEDIETIQALVLNSLSPKVEFPISNGLIAATSNDLGPAPMITTGNEYLDSIWEKVVLNTESFGTQALLKQHGRLLNFDSDEAVIGFPTKLLPMVESRAKRIKVAFTKATGREIKIRLIGESTLPKQEKDSHQ